VLAVDNLARGKKENLVAGLGLAEADVRDEDGLDRVFREFRPEVVNHHAAQVSVRDSVSDPIYDADVNVMGSLNLLQLCLSHSVKRFMFASTGGAIYGEQEVFPATEDHPARPLSPYAIAKLAVEKYLFFYEQTHGLSWASLRYANVYGPRQDPFGEAGVVAIFCQRLLAGGQLIINGDGEQTRDYVFVEDVARANLLALEKKIAGPVNVATGIETTVNQIFHELKNLAGSAAQEQHGPAKPGEQRRSVLSPALAQQIMDWAPLTELKSGLAKTEDFFRKK
jgi:UDP-glucose 4-epimerase